MRQGWWWGMPLLFVDLFAGLILLWLVFLTAMGVHARLAVGVPSDSGESRQALQAANAALSARLMALEARGEGESEAGTGGLTTADRELLLGQLNRRTRERDRLLDNALAPQGAQRPDPAGRLRLSGQIDDLEEEMTRLRRDHAGVAGAEKEWRELARRKEALETVRSHREESPGEVDEAATTGAIGAEPDVGEPRSAPEPPLTPAMARARGRLIAEIRAALETEGIPVAVDEERGALFLTRGLLFAPGAVRLSAAGDAELRSLARLLQRLLPCHLESGESPRPAACPPQAESARLEAVVIEGFAHPAPTDSARFRYNRRLAALRALWSHNALTREYPGLHDLKNPIGQPLIRLAAHADRSNPAYPRRVEIRFRPVSP